MAEYIPIEAPRTLAGMNALTRDDARRLSAQGQLEGARTQLAEALTILGRFEEALSIETDDVRLERIRALMQAELVPDDERCECKCWVDVADYTRNPNAKPKLEPTANYVRFFRYWSAKYGCMVWNYVCAVCRHSNSVPDAVAAGDIRFRK